MDTLLKHVIKAVKRCYKRKWSFAAVFSLSLFLMLFMLQELGVAPYQLAEAQTPQRIVRQAQGVSVPAAAVGLLPTKVEIPALGKTVTVNNPESTDLDVLDNALLSGAVRYPTSAKLGTQGNVLIFGHSSRLPVVHNQAFRAFNGIETLEAGDAIVVSSKGYRFIYAVETVEEVKAESAEIEIDISGAKLTLATCDTFKTKSDRFVVTAGLVAVERI